MHCVGEDELRPGELVRLFIRDPYRGDRIFIDDMTEAKRHK